MGKCLLCGDTDIKLVKSHIIPKSLYGKTLNSEEGAAQIITDKKGVYPKRSPKGVYDPNILCMRCEFSFSDWDHYANDLFMNTTPNPAFIAEDGRPECGEYPTFDKGKLQMFFISLVWRMHVTTHVMFRRIRIGPYEKKAKTAIEKKDPNLFPELDVVISRFDSELSEAFMGPIREKIEGVNIYKVGFSQHLCLVKIDKRPFPYPYNLMAISRGNPLRILYREFDGSPEKKAMIEIAKGQR